MVATRHRSASAASLRLNPCMAVNVMAALNRGDNAFNFAQNLRVLLESLSARADLITKMVIRGLVSTLENSNENSAKATRVQSLRPWAECQKPSADIAQIASALADDDKPAPVAIASSDDVLNNRCAKCHHTADAHSISVAGQAGECNVAFCFCRKFVRRGAVVSVCEDCNGRGTLTFGKDHAHDGKTLPCPMCKGTGATKPTPPPTPDDAGEIAKFIGGNALKIGDSVWNMDHAQSAEVLAEKANDAHRATTARGREELQRRIDDVMSRCQKVDRSTDPNALVFDISVILRGTAPARGKGGE